MSQIYKGIDFKYLLISMLILMFNVVFVSSLPVMAVFSYFQFFFLIYILLSKGTKDFVLTLFLFTATSFEVVAYVDIDSDYLYSITNLPILGFTGYFFLLVSSIYIVLLKNKFKISANLNANYKLLLFFSFYIVIAGILGAFVCSISNDNDVPNVVFLTYLKQDFAVYVSTTLFILLFVLHITYYPELLDELKKRVFTLLISIILITLFSVCFNFYGYYGSHEIILMPLTSFYSILILFFAFRKDLFNQKLVFLLFLICLYLQFTYSTALGGKSWLLLMMLFILVLLMYYRKGHKFAVLIGVLFLSVVILVVFTSILPTLMYNSDDDLMAGKVVEALSLFDFSSGNYLDNISASPKNRFDEFINISIEFYNKPYFSIFGKGFGGTIRDHENLFGSFLASYYRDDEYLFNAFTFMHESINNIFLKTGLWGLSLFIIIILKIFRTKNLNAFLAIGLVWLIFFFGYTKSLAAFGIVALLVGWANEKDELIQNLDIQDELKSNE